MRVQIIPDQLDHEPRVREGLRECILKGGLATVSTLDIQKIIDRREGRIHADVALVKMCEELARNVGAESWSVCGEDIVFKSHQSRTRKPR